MLAFYSCDILSKWHFIIIRYQLLQLTSILNIFFKSQVWKLMKKKKLESISKNSVSMSEAWHITFDRSMFVGLLCSLKINLNLKRKFSLMGEIIIWETGMFIKTTRYKYSNVLMPKIENNPTIAE